MSRLWSALRRWLTQPVPIPVAGEDILTRCIACERCDLFRRPASPVIECSCGRVYTEAEYVELVKYEEEFENRAM